MDVEVRSPALASSVFGSLLLGIAIILLMRAKRRLILLRQRREFLEARTKSGGPTTVIVLMLLLLRAGSLDAQQLTPNPFELVVPQPPAAVTALGREHLVYELHVTNFGTESHRIERLVALGQNGTRVLGDWTADELATRIMIVGDPGAKRTILNAGERAVIHIWISLPPDAEPLLAIRHRLITRKDGVDRADDLESTAISVLRSTRTIETLPVRPGRWVALRGPSNTSGHRRSVVSLDGRIGIPQRFAIDWAALGDDGRLFRNNGSANTDWYGYGQPVMAALKGKIVKVVDGIAENDPMSTTFAIPLSRETIAGNLVVVDCGKGIFATYAHLKPGSIRVKEGKEVSAGEVLGDIGNSGHSLGPHLHFHVSDTADSLAGEGLPFEIAEFQLIGRVDDVPALLGGREWKPSPARPSRRVTNEIPLENMILEMR
jgi:murein DD-endopeptidase MepM/ murein hydrolase activator NlpD